MRSPLVQVQKSRCVGSMQYSNNGQLLRSQYERIRDEINKKYEDFGLSDYMHFYYFTYQ